MKNRERGKISGEEYRIIFEQSSDAVFIVSADFRIRDVNHAGVAILGYDTKEEVLAWKSAYDLFANKKYQEVFQDRLSAGQGHIRELETRLVKKQGEVFDALVTSSTVDGLPTAATDYIFFVRDITKIKRAQRDIKVRNLRLATLNSISMTVSNTLDLKEMLDRTIKTILKVLESDSVRIYLLDEEGGFLNLAAYRGQSARFIGKPHMQRRAVGDGYLGRAVLTKETRILDNFSRPEDPYVDSFIEEGLHLSAYMPLISKGDVVGVMCISRHSKIEFSPDFLEFLQAIGNQIGVAIHNANLYKNVKDAYEELKIAQELVIRSEKLASLGKLAATVAHEINNPLAAVLTYIKLMLKLVSQQQFIPSRMADISRYLETMERETARCGEIVKNLLAFSRQSSVHISIHNIEEIIDKCILLLAHDLDIRGIQLKKRIDPGLPRIRCDFKQIQQAFLNLMSNASESMTERGTLTIEAKIPERKGYVEISFTDTGCGIPEEEVKNVFEPFFTTKEEGKGVGLGLSVVYGIISKHHGSVEVESKPGEGSTFRAYLPCA